MRKKKLLAVTLVMLLSIISISSLFRIYADKPIKMIYKLKDGESSREVAERFKVTEFKVDDEYMMFEVK